MSDIPKVSKKESIVLDQLMLAQEMFGLELVEKSEGHLSLSSIYTTLHRMEEKGLVSSRVEEKPSEEVRRPRRLYKITGIGKVAYRQYINNSLYTYKAGLGIANLQGSC